MRCGFESVGAGIVEISGAVVVEGVGAVIVVEGVRAVVRMIFFAEPIRGRLL